MYTKLFEQIKNFNKIIILRHVSPDPDALGSQYGLAELIKDNFSGKTVLCGGLEKSNLHGSFFPEIDLILDDDYLDSLVIVCDSATSNRIDDQRFVNAKSVIKLDHHPISEDYGDIQIVDETSSATCQMVAIFMKLFEEQLLISSKCATYVYMGLISDNGRYLHNTISSETLEMGAFLLKKGALLDQVHETLYLRDTAQIRLQAHLLLNFEITEKGVCYYYLTPEILDMYGVELEVAKEFVHILANIKDAKIWVSFTFDSENNLYRTSIRSRNVVINEVASQFGGGGHKFASGVKLLDVAMCEQLISTLDQLL